MLVAAGDAAEDVVGEAAAGEVQGAVPRRSAVIVLEQLDAPGCASSLASRDSLRLTAIACTIPSSELESSAFQAPFENPQRAELILAALLADGSFEVVEPAEWGTAPIEAVHDPGLVRFLASAWAEYQREVGPTHDVVPDVFAMAGLRAGMGDGHGEPSQRVGAARLVVLRDDDADHRGHVRGGAVGGRRRLVGGERRARRRADRLRAVPAARASRGDDAVRRLLLLQQRGDRRPPPRVDDRRSGRRARRRLPPRQRHPADLLRARRRRLRVVARRPAARLPVPHRLRRRDRRRTRVGARRRTSRCRRRSTTTATSPCSTEPSTPSTTSTPPSSSSRSASTRSAATRSATWRCTTDGFRRCGAAVAARGRPLVVLQEGGYAGDALGANAVAWLTGAARPLIECSASEC